MKPVRLSGFVQFLLSLVSVILCVALFATSVVAIVLAQTRTLTTEDNMKTLIRYIMFGGEQKKAPFFVQAVGGMRLEEASEEEESGEVKDVIIDMLYEMFGEQFGEEIPFSEEDVEELLDQSTLPDFLSDKMAGIMTDIYTGEVSTTITGAEVGQLIQENKQLIEDTFGIEVTDEYVSNIVEQVNSMDVTTMVQNVILGKDPTAAPEEGGESGTLAGTVSGMPELFADGVLSALISGQAGFNDLFEGGIPVILALIREVTSADMLNMVLIACAILVALLFVVNLVQIHMAVRYVAVTTILASLPFAGASIAALVAPSLFSGSLLSVLYMVLTINAPLSIGVLVGGVVLFVVSCILTGIYNKQMYD